MKKLLSIILTLSLISLLFVGCGKDKRQDVEDVTVSEVTHTIFYAAQYVALHNGYFEDEGLNVEFVNAGGADKVMTSVITGAADIGLAGPEACIYVQTQGKEDSPKIFAQLTSCDGSFLMGRDKQEKFEWESLKNSTILPGRKGGMPYMTLLYALNKNGLELDKDVFFNDTIQFNAMTGAFLSGEGDYVTVFEPSATELEMQDKAYILASVGQEAGKVPYTTYFASKDCKKDTIKSFVKAIKRGQEFVKQKTPIEIAKAIQPSFKETPIEVIEQVVKRYKDIGAYSYTPVLEEEDFNLVIDIMKNANELSHNAVVKFEDIVDNTYAR